MKKYLIGSLIFFTLLNTINAQTWHSLAGGLPDAACGGWENPVTCITTYNENLYAGGNCTPPPSVGSSNDIGSWNGSNWDTLSLGLWSCIGPKSLVVYNGELYAGGAFYEAGRTLVNNIAKWNGASWSTVGTGISINGVIYAMAVYNGNLYVGGSFDTAGGIPVNNIAMWNGTTWTAVGSGITPFSYFSFGVFSMYVFNGNLYVGGNFNQAGGNPATNIAMWNGTTWSAVGSGIGYGSMSIGMTEYEYCVFSLSSYNGNLYAGGIFDSAGNVPVNNIAMWNGATWSALGNGITDGIDASYYGVRALCSYNSLLYVGGGFKSAGSIIDSGGLATWNGTTWASATGFKMSIPRGGLGWIPAILVLSVYNGYLYAGGYFDTAGSVLSVDIAGNDPTTSIKPITQSASSVSLFPNPNNGVFTLVIANEVKQSQVEVYNMLGEKVYSENMPQTLNEINLSGKPNGVYLYRVLTEDGKQIGTGKFIME